MNNGFLVQLFDWEQRVTSIFPRTLNKLFWQFKAPWVIRRITDVRKNMTNVEQRLNLWHLASQPLAYGVPGDFVELGCFDGKTAVIFARLIEHFDSDRRLHLYDHFRISFNLTGRDIEQELIHNFRTANCPEPVIHAGDFMVTVPKELPDKIAFVHIDCGFGGDVEMHKLVLLHLFQHVYPRMPSGAIAVLMDYYDPSVNTGANFNPGATLAANEFLADKPEKVSALWANECTHGYFRKI